MADSDTGDGGLLHALVLDGRGGARALSWTGFGKARGEGETLWLHFDRGEPRARDWIAGEAGLDETVAEALLAEEPRPRCVARPDGTLLILRGVNLNPGSDPEDMVSLRMWITAGRILTVRHRRVMAVTDVRRQLEGGTGPHNSGELVAELAERLSERMEPVLADLEDRTDDLEVGIVTSFGGESQSSLGEIRREAVALRRYLAPQREALERLKETASQAFDPSSRHALVEAANRVMRYVEDLDSIRERAQVMHDEIAGRVAEKLNRTMYLLSVIALIFLPLTFFTGLLGINVGGIPLQSELGFGVVTAILVAAGVLEVVLVRRMRLL